MNLPNKKHLINVLGFSVNILSDTIQIVDTKRKLLDKKASNKIADYLILEGYFDKFIKKNPDQQIKIEIFRKK
tara:strand:+ start:292 stop:510 length:219 start_codon:yes stop_codon:yes gene_type:complete